MPFDTGAVQDIPQCAEFLQTISADEQKWMKQHGAFLDSLLSEGKVVAHGPVMDSAGGYGVSFYPIADDEIQAITSQDPIVKNWRKASAILNRRHGTAPD
ncbi:YciI family protein [Rhizobium leguminosarum]|uniref:YCII-related domain-containing protein n=2 Tax=Rhizobium leguminosarum TaxID=384 RepID=A0A154IDY1_RHILE|nr:YciI family protein [Rhizobium leguminosarum]KZA98169.1 hypothetical protein A4A59_28605 [Rhizobium leguminosarum]